MVALLCLHGEPVWGVTNHGPQRTPVAALCDQWNSSVKCLSLGGVGGTSTGDKKEEEGEEEESCFNMG
jgi:hypothetical protein